tara:strand:+ start:3994 stop:4737 length:744 start_codon:yes stop_codon:yes gene_type:complete
MALTRGIKKKDHEKLTDANISNVIKLLSDEKPITKKEACEILNIRYNTTRLQRIIDEFQDVYEYRENRKAKLRGTGATREEIKSVIEEYLEGSNISTIATRMYRSNAFVKAIIERVGVPQKLADTDYEGQRNSLLPEECIAEEFEVGEKVWYPRKNKFAIIKREITPEYQASMPGYMCYGNIDECVNYEDKYGAKGYALKVLDPIPQHEMDKTLFPWLDGSKVGFHSFALAYDIGSLRHLEKYGVHL